MACNGAAMHLELAHWCNESVSLQGWPCERESGPYLSCMPTTHIHSRVLHLLAQTLQQRAQA